MHGNVDRSFSYSNKDEMWLSSNKISLIGIDLLIAEKLLIHSAFKIMNN